MSTPTNTPTLTDSSFIGSTISPVILPISILFYSACQPTTAGIPYIVFLIIFVLFRTAIFKKIQSDPEFNNNLVTNKELCLYNIPFIGEVTTISVFVSVFTLMYIFLPMVVLSTFNYLVLILLVCYTLTITGLQQKCYIQKGKLIIDIFLGLGFAAVSYGILIAINNSMNTPDKNFLFLSSNTSNGQQCSMASKQNFLCSVYKNGQLVSTTPNIPGMSTPTPAYT